MVAEEAEEVGEPEGVGAEETTRTLEPAEENIEEQENRKVAKAALVHSVN